MIFAWRIATNKDNLNQVILSLAEVSILSGSNRHNISPSVVRTAGKDNFLHFIRGVGLIRD
jgi:hypothetical protein